MMTFLQRVHSPAAAIRPRPHDAPQMVSECAASLAITLWRACTAHARRVQQGRTRSVARRRRARLVQLGRSVGLVGRAWLRARRALGLAVVG